MDKAYLTHCDVCTLIFLGNFLQNTILKSHTKFHNFFSLLNTIHECDKDEFFIHEMKNGERKWINGSYFVHVD